MRKRLRPRADPAFPFLGPEERLEFPDPRRARGDEPVCSGGNLSPGLLLSAYSQGLFPWFNEEDPILWWSPDPRFVLEPARLHVGGTMRKLLRKGGYELSLDRDFPAVIAACSAVPRPGQRGTWITDDMVEGYVELHRLGYAHSAEIRREGRLVGGLYGVSLGSIFCGESMFSLEDDASKLAFIPLVWRLQDEGFTLVDSQVYTDHMAGLGAVEIPREDYLARLARALEAPTRRGSWAEAFPGYPLSDGFRRTVLKEAS